MQFVNQNSFNGVTLHRDKPSIDWLNFDVDWMLKCIKNIETIERMFQSRLGKISKKYSPTNSKVFNINYMRLT